MRIEALRRLYDRSAGSLPVLGSPQHVVEQIRRETDSTEEAAERITQHYTVLSSATGFVLGLPGYITMPITVPSNIAGVLLLQFHMCAAMAVLGGKDPQTDAVRERAIDCVLDGRDTEPEQLEADTSRREPDDMDDDDAFSLEELNDETEGLLARLTTKLGERGIRFLGEQTVRWLGRTAANHAGKGARGLPLLGGVIGGLTDGYSTREIGQRARRAFLPVSV